MPRPVTYVGLRMKLSQKYCLNLEAVNVDTYIVFSA